MALLGEMLFPAADYRRTTGSLLIWWESRRLLFNGVVGAAGLFTLLVIRLIAMVPPGVPMPTFDWRPVVAYGILANVCYTFGWALEATAQRIWKNKCPAFGPALFRQGLSFSVGLSLLPIIVVGLGWLVRLGLTIFR